MTALIDSIGAQLISLKSGSGTEYIWQRDPAHWKSCSPLLFPTVGNCRDGKYTLNGKTYTIPKHGFCRNADFAVSVLSEQEASFTLTDSPETRAQLSVCVPAETDLPHCLRMASRFTMP